MKNRLCGCLSDVNEEEFWRSLHHPDVGLVEWRLDLFIQQHSVEKVLELLPVLGSLPRHPLLVTNRSKHQGGVFEGPEALRIELLQKAAEAGAEWVDLEEETSADVVEWFQSRDVRVVLSYHDFADTHDRIWLRDKMERMSLLRPQVLKIATYAHQPDANLRILELIPFGRKELNLDVIAFCMGPLGRWSRVVSLLLGSPWTYVQLPGQRPAAPGQFTSLQMLNLLESMI